MASSVHQIYMWLDCEAKPSETLGPLVKNREDMPEFLVEMQAKMRKAASEAPVNTCFSLCSVQCMLGLIMFGYCWAKGCILL